MSGLTINNLGRGLNTYDPASEIADGQMAFARNMLFTRGAMKTAPGFAKFAASGLPLDTALLGLCHYQEQSRNPTDHVVAMTRRKLWRWDSLADDWADISPSSGLNAGPDSIPSFVGIPHTDAITEDGTACYYHLLACDGGESPIYRWAGKFEDTFHELAGADGYHETDADPATPTAHYAAQVNTFFNHVILLNPKTWNAASDEFIQNPQTVLWGKPGKVETAASGTAFTITDTGAGYVALMDTGGQNLWCAALGASQLIVYQDNSIWYLYHVNSDPALMARLQIPNLGLLAAPLIVPWKNAHYLVGSDYQLYRYTGGTTMDPIGKQVFESLQEDIDPAKLNRCRMSVDANGRMIWIFVVRPGYAYPTRAYGVDAIDGSWTIRDFEHLYDASHGIVAAALMGGQSYVTGKTWQQDINEAKTYTQAIAAGTTWDQLIDTVLTDDGLMVADDSGYVYQVDETLTADDGTNIVAVSNSKVFDFGAPGVEKWWSMLYLVAKGSAMRVSYRIDSFETNDEGWVAFSPTTLTDAYQSYGFELNVTSDQIQFRIANYAGSSLVVKKMVINPPVGAPL